MEELHILHMHKLKMIWHDELQTDSFCKLKVLKLEYGKGLLKVFSSEMFRRFRNVEELIVKNCDSLREVFDFQALIKEQDIVHFAASSQLRTLFLGGLLNLQNVWNGDPQGLLSFHNLRYIYAWNCPSLKSLFPFSISQNLPTLELLSIDGCGVEELVSKEERVEENPKFEFPQIKYLTLWRSERLRCFYSKKHVLECPLLQKLSVYLCDKLEIFASEPQDLQRMDEGKHESPWKSEVAQPLFSFKKIISNLEELSLNFKDIPLIRQGQFPVQLFRKLKVLQLQRSDDSSAKFPFHFLQEFKNLEKLILGICSFKFLFPHGIVAEEVEAFSKIRYLKLDGLYYMRQIWDQDCQPGQILRNLQTLEIWDCSSLISLAPPSVSFQNLTILDVFMCGGLSNLVSYSTAKSMVNLTSMSVRECRKVTEIVTEEGDEFLSQREIIFNKLASLRLLGLLSLTSFCSSASCIIKFPSLEEVFVSQCPSMKFFSERVSTPKLKRVYAAQGTDKWHWIGDLNTTVRYFYTEMFGFHGLQKLKLSEYPEIKEAWRHGQLLVNPFYNLTALYLDQCVHSTIAVPSDLLPLLNNLEELEVRNCNSMEQVFGVERPNASGVVGYLSKLNKLYLSDLPGLRLLWNEVLEESSGFKNLKMLKIHNCCSLRFIFTPIMCMGVMQLQELEVTSCDMLEEIVTTGFLEEETLKDTIFPLLNSITLKSLPNLTNFYSGGGIVQCPSLEKITIKKCPAISAIPFFRKPESDATDGIIEKKVFSSNLKDLHLSSLNIEKIWHAGQLDILYCFHNLTTLRVDQCDNLTYLFSSSMVKSVMHLKRLEIFYCKMMKEIIVLEGLEEEMKSKMLLPQIDFLSLNDLPKLTQFCSSDLIECPVLKELWIQKCPELIKFVSTSDSSEHKMTNSTLFDEKVAFPSLEQMTISKSDNLKIIWGNELHSNSFSKMKVLKVDNNKELLKLFPSSMLTSLQNLEDLVIRNCDSLKQVFDIKEARSTKETVAYQLAKLNVQELPNSKGLNENPQGLVLFDKLKSVSIWNCPNLKILFPRFDTQVRVVLDKLFSVVVSDCPSLEFLFTSSIARCLPQLTSLSMSNCGMKELVAKDEVAEEAPQFVYPQLKFLDLKKLKELKCFYPGIYTLECAMLEKLLVLECEKLKVFSSANSENLIGKKTESQRQIQIPESFFSFEKIIVRLKELTVNYKDIPLIGQLPVELFDKLTVLHLQGSDGDASADFPFDFIQRLKNLENLVLSSFYMKVLLPQGIAGENAEILAKLLNLQLSDLPNMRYIWNHDFQPGQVLQNLQSLQILACDSLICLAPPSASFQNLVTLNVWRCRGMKSVISMSTAKSMVNLTSLSITECDMVTEIVANQGEESQYQSQNEINFNKLSYLNLHCLRSITSFCSSDSCIIKFPLLENIVVTQCPRLKVFSKGVLNAPRLKGVLAKNTMLWIGDLNTTIKHMFTEMIGFYGLHDLRLSEVPKLKEVWHSQIPVNSLDSSSNLIIGHSEPPKLKEELNGEVLVDFLHSLRNLVVDECALSPNAVPSNLLPFLNNLEELEVRNCNSVEQVCGGMECQNASGVVGNLSKLNKLQLINLPRLMFVWNEVPKGSLDFKDLRVLKVHGCSKLRHLFTPTMCLGLGQLQEVKVKYCDVVEEIITGAGEENTVDKIIFPLLNSISLESLPNLINFSSGSGIVQCPTLEVLSIVNCPANFACKILGEPEANATYETTAAKQVLFPKLKDLKLSLVKFEKIWHARQWEMSHLLQNLTVWNLDGCSNLKYLLSSSMVKSLPNLKILEICNCTSMEEIIVIEGFEGQMGKLFLPELNILKLKDLPKLVHFCRSDLLECPALENLWIEECPELGTFISNARSSNKTAGNELEMLNSSLFDEKVVFPNLKLLVLLKVGGFKVIWSNELREDSFCKLKTLKVEAIKELQEMFPAKLVTRFQNLKWLGISCCDALQLVFNLQGLIIGKEAHAVEAVPLKQLKLFNLPNLKYVWNEDPGGILEFQDLCIMDAIDCPNLKCLFPNSMARNLHRLQELQVVNCAMEEIVAIAEKEVIETSAKFEFPKLTSLRLGRLPQLRRFFSGTHTLHWPVLKNLYVTQCNTVQILASNSQSFQEQCKEKKFETQVEHPSLSFTKIIPNLEGLALNSKDAAVICEDQFPMEFFHKLKVLELNFFDDETADFPSSVLQKFNHLETLIIAYGTFKELMPHGGLVGKEKPLITFPKIQSLVLHRLPNLIYIWHSESQLHQFLQYLGTLLVENCDKLISLAPSSTSLRFLTTLGIMSCKGLISLVTSSTAKSMSQLKKLSISECNEMKEIVSNDGDSTEDEIIFIRLENLEMHCLLSLASFSSGKQRLKFPSLTEVIVSQCPKLQVFSNESVSTPTLQTVMLTREKDRTCWNGNLNTTIEKLFKGMHPKASERNADKRK